MMQDKRNTVADERTISKVIIPLQSSSYRTHWRNGGEQADKSTVADNNIERLKIYIREEEQESSFGRRNKNKTRRRAKP